MKRRKVFYFGLEPLKARYTYQLCKEWMPATFKTYKDKLMMKGLAIDDKITRRTHGWKIMSSLDYT